MKRIDLDTWDRRDQYLYFSGMQNPYWSLTCEIGVAPVRAFMRQRAIPSYIGLIHLVTRAANSVPELRLRIVDGVVCEFDVVHPSFTVLNKSGRLFFCRARVHADPAQFVERTRKAMDETKDADECSLAATGHDVLYLTCLPWIHFTAISHPITFSPPDSIPRISWGRFEDKGDRTVLALNVHVHHGLADGFHVAQFVQRLEAFCAEPEVGFAGGRTEG